MPAYALSTPARPGSAALHPYWESGVAVYELEIAETPISVAGRKAAALTINGTVPGPLLHFHEGQESVIRVTNRLDEDTSLHWHGILLPPEMDGVPGVSFPGILPGQTFEYRFPMRQYGTYWYHSHSGLQEQLGHYGPLIIHPAEGYPYDFDREYTIVLSDWTFENPYTVLAKLKKQGNYYNRQRLTVIDFFKDVVDHGLWSTVRNRLMWAEMRMDPTDISDVTGATYTYLLNGLAPKTNWTGLFQPGERVLLHIVNASAATFFDVRIPDLPMTVVQANGQYVEPVETDEFRMAVAETYDVVIRPPDERAYTFFAEAMDRSGYARGTLAPHDGMSGPVPDRRERPVLTMADMGMVHDGMEGLDHGEMTMKQPADPAANHPHDHDGQVAMEMPSDTMTGGPEFAIAGNVRTAGLQPPGTLPEAIPHEPDEHGPGNAAAPDVVRSRLHEPGIGLGDDGWRVLTYAQLRALHPEPRRAPDREIELHLTGNMERFMWSINGIAFTDSELIPFEYGERIRLTMVNDTMMSHPMHLHGMWMELENGQGEHIPRVHTIDVKPAERISLLVTADAPGMWAFHCHILYHMDVGMFRVVKVSEPDAITPEPMEEHQHHE